MSDALAKTLAVLQAFAAGQAAAEELIGAACQLAGAQHGWLLTASSPNNAQPFAVFRLPPEAITLYTRDFVGRDVQLDALQRKFGEAPPPVLTDETAMPLHEFQRSDLYDGFYRPLGIERMMRLDSGHLDAFGGAAIRLLVARGPGAEAFRDETNVFRHLLPHFNAAATVWAQRLSAGQSMLAAAFEQAQDAISILDAEGRCRYENVRFAALRQAARAQNGAAVERPLEARALAPLRAPFRQLVRDTAVRGAAVVHCTLVLGAGDAQRHHAVTITSLAATPGVPASPGGPLFLLALRESATFGRDQLAALAAQYRLTPAQHKTLGLLVDGGSVRSIAESQSVSIHTVRQHVKAILHKTGCRRQSQLLQLVARTVPPGLRILM